MNKFMKAKNHGYKDAMEGKFFDPHCDIICNVPEFQIDHTYRKGYEEGYKEAIESLVVRGRVSEEEKRNVFNYIEGYFKGTDKIITSVLNSC